MVKMVASIVNGHEPNVVCGESSRSSRRILSDGIRLAIAISHGDCFKRTGPVTGRGLDHKINRSIEVPQQSFALILACFLDYFHERGYCRTVGVVGFVVRFNAKVKMGPVEQHLVSKGFPDAKEISLLIHFDRVISERITRAIIRAGRRRETNHNCDNRYKCCGYLRPSWVRSST